MTTPKEIRLFLESEKVRVRSDHRAGAAGTATCVALTGAMDRAVRAAFDGLPAGQRDRLAILGLGGYGRAELFPWSDVDLMVLYEKGTDEETAREGARRLLHTLWDAGVHVGHSVRTAEETLQLRGSSLDAWTGVLEGRLVCGNGETAEALFSQLSAAGGDPWFVRGILADLSGRLDRFGSSVKLLEPNLKKSAGGLRDLHGTFWLYRACEPGFFFTVNPAKPAMAEFADLLADRAILDVDQHRRLTQAVEFLFRTRHEVHFQRETPHDTLEYVLQRAVAESLGFGRLAELHSVEVFMREYYRHARTVHRLCVRLAERFREQTRQDAGGSGRVTLGDGLFVERGVVSCDPVPDRFPDAESVLTAFAVAAERDAEIGPALQHTIERSTGVFGPGERSSPVLGPLFGRILRSSRVAETLRLMNDLGILGAYIPEWADLVAFFQHNVYHYYTADEHTLIAVGNAERLRVERGPLREVFRLLRRKDLLYLSVLLHDIAKPRGVADHEITGVEVAAGILKRLGMEGDAEEIGFLIRNHLVMEQVAFRRNIHDPATVRDFAARFVRPEQLSYLYVLTYADLSAVNPSVWTGWKAAMLQELYRRTSEVLRRNLRGEQIERFHRERAEAAAEQIVESLSAELPREDVERHLGGFQDDAYVATFSEREIREHIDRSREGGVSVLFAPAGVYTEITVIAPDAPFALSRCCAVLAANDASIFDANIFTRDDRVLIDRFRVADEETHGALGREACGKIEDDLRRVLAGSIDIEHLFQEHRRRWKRRPKPPMNPNVRTDVQFEETARHTIIDVYAPDSLGLLFRVTEAISTVGLDIYFAKIATRVDGIVDAFYVLDRDGRKIDDEDRRAVIRDGILAALSRLAMEQLDNVGGRGAGS